MSATNGTLTAPAATESTPAPVRTLAPSLVARMGERYGVDADKMMGTLKATAFRQRAGKDNKPPPEVTNEQMMALLVVADQYRLNPWTKEIYAFPQDGGIMPIVGVDGWIRMMNEHPQFDGLEFVYGPELEAKDEQERRKYVYHEWVECIIHRKDRTRPYIVREYFVECHRNTGPWNTSPKRMLRHKALIQGGRIAFGFAGIYDEDDGEAILDAVQTPKRIDPPTGRVHHNRLANVLPPSASLPPATVNGTSKPAETQETITAEGEVIDEALEIKRQELIDSIGEQLGAELSPKQMHDLAATLHRNHDLLGEETHAEMMKLYAAKSQAKPEPAKSKRDF